MVSAASVFLGFWTGVGGKEDVIPLLVVPSDPALHSDTPGLAGQMYASDLPASTAFLRQLYSAVLILGCFACSLYISKVNILTFVTLTYE